MKKISYAIIASALFASTASAELPASSSNPATCANFSGFFLGAVLGYGSGQAKTSGELVDSRVPAAPVTLRSKEIDIALKGANGGLALGYGKTLGNSKVYVGVDLELTVDQANGKSYVFAEEINPAAGANPIMISQSIEFKRKNSLQIGPRIGLVFGNAMPFIKLGWENSKYEGKVVSGNASFGSLLKFSKRLDGFYVGAGIDVKLTQKIVTGIQYIYTSSKQDSIKATAGSLATAVKMRPTHNLVQFKVAYQF